MDHRELRRQLKELSLMDFNTKEWALSVDKTFKDFEAQKITEAECSDFLKEMDLTNRIEHLKRVQENLQKLLATWA
tara:strand:- start:6974 stop:7201 length:228 start_codon:yes stop_codon:yes gene_type:complete